MQAYAIRKSTTILSWFGAYMYSYLHQVWPTHACKQAGAPFQCIFCQRIDILGEYAGDQAKVVLDDVLERLPEMPNLDEIRARAEEPSPYTMVALQARTVGLLWLLSCQSTAHCSKCSRIFFEDFTPARGIPTARHAPKHAAEHGLRGSTACLQGGREWLLTGV